MSWISEMISGIRIRKAAEGVEATRHPAQCAVETVTEQIAGAKDAWTELLLRLKHDVKEFNSDKARAAHSAVLISSEKFSLAHFQFEVYLPEMQSKLLVLTLSGNNLDVEIRPQFPGQKSSITVEVGKSGKDYRWMLAGLENDKEKTAAQLSEYLLKPILSSATID